MTGWKSGPMTISATGSALAGSPGPNSCAASPIPVDRRLWGWPPQIVNASYSPLMNQITFPGRHPAGTVLRHECGPGNELRRDRRGDRPRDRPRVDDNGRRFDAEGRIRDWWTQETNERFVERSDRLVEQYNQFCPFENECVNGRSLWARISAIWGGMQMAYEAYRNYAAENYPDGEPPVIDGFTGDQRFLLAWGAGLADPVPR